MWRSVLLLILAVAVASPAQAQVQVTELAAPDAFSTAGRETGLPSELWRGTPVELARVVLPLMATKPLSPAAAQLARRVLATGAPGPEGTTADGRLTGGRASALIALGDVVAAARILERAPGLERSADLSRAAAEMALLTGEVARACAISDALTEGRGEIYWLRLRAFCQVEAGRVDQAHLTFDLAQTQARDVIYGRFMSARLGGGAPGAAALRNGLDLALSRSLKLDLAVAKPASAVASALSGQDPVPPVFDVAAIDLVIGGLGASLRDGLPPEAGVSALVAAATDADPKTRARLQGAALLLTAFSTAPTGPDRTRLAGFAIPEGKSPAGRNVALAAAAEGRRMGEVALLTLWICADAGASGPGVADRARIVGALARVGLVEDAQAFALEGLAGLK